MSTVDPVGATGAIPAATATATATPDPATFSDALARALDLDRVPQVTLSAMATAWTPEARPAAISTSGAVLRAMGGTSSVQIPPELRAHGNGRIPIEALQPIGVGQHRMWRGAAEAFVAMHAAAAAEGVTIGVTDSYRSYAQQVALADDKGLYREGGWAAVPGTSQHGWGLAVDIDVTPSGLAWMRSHAAEYGFVEAVPREPWHWEYHGFRSAAPAP